MHVPQTLGFPPTQGAEVSAEKGALGFEHLHDISSLGDLGHHFTSLSFRFSNR